LGVAVKELEGLAPDAGQREARDRRGLASPGLSPFLELDFQPKMRPYDITDQRPRPRATGQDCRLLVAALAANASLSRFGEGQGAAEGAIDICSLGDES